MQTIQTACILIDHPSTVAQMIPNFNEIAVSKPQAPNITRRVMKETSRSRCT